jgi:hypothetical protein
VEEMGRFAGVFAYFPKNQLLASGVLDKPASCINPVDSAGDFYRFRRLFSGNKQTTTSKQHSREYEESKKNAGVHFD